MRELYRTLGVKLAATMAYHPQGDGQAEQINQELEQFLQLFINQRQDDWDDLVRGHPQNLIPITKSDNSASAPATALYIPPHRRYIHYVKT